MMKEFQNKIDEMVSKILKEEIEKKSAEMSEKMSKGQEFIAQQAKPKNKITADDFKKLRDSKKKENNENIDKEVEEEIEENESPKITGGVAFADVNGFNNLTLGEGRKKEESKEENEEKWIQKTDMKKGALRKKLGVPEGEKIPKSKLNSLKKELMKKGEGDKKLSAADSKLLKQVNLALTLGGLKEEKQTLQLTESELVDMIEQIVMEQKSQSDKKVKDSFKMKTPIGLAEVEKANKETGKDNSDEVSKVTKKLKEYLKDGSKEDFTMEPKHFPKGNGEMAEMKKKAYKASDAVEEYIDNFAYPGLENTHYDEIKPNDEWLTKNLEGSSETGNNPEWANAVDTGLGKKVNEKRKKNMYQQEKQKSYNRVAQPIETAGEHEGEKSLDKMFAKLESTEDKKQKLVNEEMYKMKHMINYNRKTQ